MLIITDLYNKANPKLRVKKFSDHYVACRRTFIHLPKLAKGQVAPKVGEMPNNDESNKPKKAKAAPKGPHERKHGVCYHIWDYIRTHNGVTKDEVLEYLTTVLPNRDPEAMRGTVNVNIHLSKVVKRSPELHYVAEKRNDGHTYYSLRPIKND